MGETQLLVKKINRSGCLTLNRPKVLNAVSLDMFAEMSLALEQWQRDPAIYGVMLDAVGERVFCAGGDIREVYERGRKEPELACEFLRREYSYNWQLENFTKPHISLMNGIVLGGGVGISLYGTHRVAGAGYTMAMPETAIGFIPDVGASWFFGHLPNSVGLYLALTGRSISRNDAYMLGLVTHCIDAKHFPSIQQAMREGEPIDPLLDGLHTDPGVGELRRLHGWIEAVFSASTLIEIFQRAEALGDNTKGWSHQVLDELKQKSPISLHLALALWKKGRTSSLRRCLQLEYRVAANLLRQKDFFEGIRAAVIDKDKSPDWQSADIYDVSKGQLTDLMKAQWGELELAERKMA